MRKKILKLFSPSNFQNSCGYQFSNAVTGIGKYGECKENGHRYPPK